MSRPLRIQYPQAVYHVMNRGLNRNPIFIDKGDHVFFFKLLEEVWKRWRIKIFAVCLMKNHYHLCFQTPEPNLSRIMRHIDGIYTQRFNRVHLRDGPLFRGRYKAMIIDEQEYLAQVIRYIHLNPVKAKMVRSPQDYEWSTHKLYVQSQKQPPWFRNNLIKEWFGNTKKFHEYVLKGNDEYIDKVYRSKRWPLVMGTPFFIDEVKKRATNLSNEHINTELEYVRPTVEQVFCAVSHVYQIPTSTITSSRRGCVNEARKMAQWILREQCDLTYKDIAELFGLGSIKTVAWSCGEIQQLLINNKKTELYHKKVNKMLTSQPET